VDGGAPDQVAPKIAGSPLLLFPGYEGLPGLFNLCAVEAALMKEESVALGEGLTLLEFKFSAFLDRLVPEGADSEGVGGEEAVVARVPPGGMAQVPVVIENGDDLWSACGVGAMIGHPAGPLAPCIVVLHPLAVGDLPLGDLTDKTQGRSSANGKAAFLGVPEGHVVPGGLHCRGHINDPGLPCEGDIISPLLQDDRLALCLPGKLCRESGCSLISFLADFRSGDPAGYDLAVVRVPEVVPIDIAVGKPEPGVVRVIGFLPGHVLDEGILPGQVGPGGTHERIEAWDTGLPVILSEEFPIDDHLQVLSFLLEIDAGRKRDGREKGKGESKSGSAHGLGDESEAGRSGRGKKECRLLPGPFRANLMPGEALWSPGKSRYGEGSRRSREERERCGFPATGDPGPCAP